MKVAPCKLCDRRRLGCHSHCEDYKAWKDELALITEARVREQKARPTICKAMEKYIWKGWKTK